MLTFVLQATLIVRQTRASSLEYAYTFESRRVRVSAIHSCIGARAQSVYVENLPPTFLPLTHSTVIPYTGVIPKTPDITSPEGRHLVLHASVTGLDASSVSLSRAFPEVGLLEPKLPYDYLVYALGNHLPEPIDTWNPVNIAAEAYDGTKPQGIQWLKHAQKRVEAAPSVLVVGGGALGIRECFNAIINRFLRRLFRRVCDGY